MTSNHGENVTQLVTFVIKSLLNIINAWVGFRDYIDRCGREKGEKGEKGEREKRERERKKNCLNVKTIMM